MRVMAGEHREQLVTNSERPPSEPRHLNGHRTRAAPRLAIVGAGPIGLEAALAAIEAGLDPTLYEAGARPAAHVRDWGHVRTFTPWSMNVSPRARGALADAGAKAPPGGDALPTGHELADHLLDPLSSLPQIGSRLRLTTRVRAIAREGLLKHEEIGTGARAARRFRLLVESDGEERVEHADAVLDCSGGYGTPNTLGDGGIPAPGEAALAARIERRLPDLEADPGAWAGRTTLLTGAGHSAQTAARGLARLAAEAPGTRVVWAVRSDAPTWQAVADDTLPERAALTTATEQLAAGASPAVEVRAGAVTEALAERDGRVAVTLRDRRGTSEVLVDRVLALNGSVGERSLHSELQVHECYATGGPMRLAAALLGAGAGDCLTQPSHGPEALENPEPGFFILGSKSYGRNGQFLMRIGWQQAEDAVGAVAAAARGDAGRSAAATSVTLNS
jgi:hypothetical protein